MHIFCSDEASLPIKSYSPELIVHPVLVTEAGWLRIGGASDAAARLECVHRATKHIEDMFPRLNSLVVGPGLGRDPLMLDIAAEVMVCARRYRMPFVVDGDGLFLISQVGSIMDVNICFFVFQLTGVSPISDQILWRGMS